MDKFFRQFPNVAVAIMLGLIGFIGYQWRLETARQGDQSKIDNARITKSIDNNTKAMNDINCTIQEVIEKVFDNKSRLEGHEIRLNEHDKRLEKGDL